MAKLQWFKMYTEAATDPKLKYLTDDKFRVWFNLLCLSAESENRGEITEERFILAIKCSSGDELLLEETLGLLQKLKIITIKENTIIFINFDKRQYENPSDLPDKVNERVKKSRNNKKIEAKNNVTSETNCNDNVTSLKREETSETTRVEESRRDKIREDNFTTTTTENFQNLENEKEIKEASEVEEVSDIYFNATGRTCNSNDFVAITGIVNSEFAPENSVKLKIIKESINELLGRNGNRDKAKCFSYFCPKILDEFKKVKIKNESPRRPEKQIEGVDDNGGFRKPPAWLTAE